MTDRFTRMAMAVALVLLGAIAAQPYIERLVFAVAAPQPVAPRGDLAESEKSTIEVFERVAPSVVQVVSLTGRTQQMGGRQGVSSGTGFVWDADGHVVTNNHVVEQAQTIGVRFASGQMIEAELVGRTPNYDLAVLRLKSGPPPASHIAV